MAYWVPVLPPRSEFAPTLPLDIHLFFSTALSVNFRLGMVNFMCQLDTILVHVVKHFWVCLYGCFKKSTLESVD